MPCECPWCKSCLLWPHGRLFLSRRVYLGLSYFLVWIEGPCEMLLVSMGVYFAHHWVLCDSPFKTIPLFFTGLVFNSLVCEYGQEMLQRVLFSVWKSFVCCFWSLLFASASDEWLVELVDYHRCYPVFVTYHQNCLRTICVIATSATVLAGLLPCMCICTDIAL